MQNIIFIPNHFDKSTWEYIEADNVIDFLMSRFDEFPENARIYEGCVSELTDITPYDDVSIDNLLNIKTNIYVIMYPKGMTTAIVVAIVAVVAAVAATILIKPKTPTTTSSSETTASSKPSPNNELQSRTNTPRVNGRIPDIFGRVYCTPDSIAPPYTMFVENQEVEYGYFCVGRGSYEINQIRDETTVLMHTSETSAEVYAPYTSPNSGHSPQIRINTPINKPLITAYRNTAVNGQVLKISTSLDGSGQSSISANVPNIIYFEQGSGDNSEGWITFRQDYNIASMFKSGDSISVSAIVGSVFIYDVTGTYTIDRLETADGAGYVNTIYVTNPKAGSQNNTKWPTYAGATGSPIVIRLLTQSVSGAGICSYPNRISFSSNQNLTSNFTTGDSLLLTAISNGYNLNGTYEILAVSDNVILLAAPAEINGNWNNIGSGTSSSIIIKQVSEHWVGPFILDQLNTTKILINLLASNGLYVESGDSVQALNYIAYAEVWKVDALGNAISGKTRTAHLVNGSKSKTTIAQSIELSVESGYRYAVRIIAVGSGVVGTNEIKWRDLYALEPVNELHFGDVTTIQTASWASTLTALSYKERKLNCIAARKIKGIGGSSSSGYYIINNLEVRTAAKDIITHISLDPYIGNKLPSDLDLNNLIEVENAIISRFGNGYLQNAPQIPCYPHVFNYTFDDANMSYEETVVCISEAIFSTAYRQGRLLKLKFEDYNEIPVMLINHRNKIPGSESRYYSFGNNNNYDCVEFTYINSDDGISKTISVPNDTGYNPKKVDSIGITNQWQAHFHAWRLWNKIQYQNNSIELEATQESQALIIKDNIIITDGTRPSFVEGEIINIDGTIATLSQSIPDEWSQYKNVQMYVQLPDGTIQVLTATLIAFIEQYAYDKNQVIISTPRLPLIVDNDYYTRTTYTLVPGESSETPIPKYSKYILEEKETNDNMTCTLTAINYDDRYYERDLDRNKGMYPSGY